MQMKRLKYLIAALAAALIISGCTSTKDYSFLTTTAGSMSIITCSGGKLDEPYQLGGNGINEFCAAMNLIRTLKVLPDDEIPEDTGYELLCYTKTSHTTMHLNPPYIGIGDSWYVVENDEDLYYLKIMVAVVERGNVYGTSE